MAQHTTTAQCICWSNEKKGVWMLSDLRVLCEPRDFLIVRSLAFVRAPLFLGRYGGFSWLLINHQSEQDTSWFRGLVHLANFLLVILITKVHDIPIWTPHRCCIEVRSQKHGSRRNWTTKTRTFFQASWSGGLLCFSRLFSGFVYHCVASFNLVQHLHVLHISQKKLQPCKSGFVLRASFSMNHYRTK